MRACIDDSHFLELLRPITAASKYLLGRSPIFRSFFHLLVASFSARGSEARFLECNPAIYSSRDRMPLRLTTCLVWPRLLFLEGGGEGVHECGDNLGANTGSRVSSLPQARAHSWRGQLVAGAACDMPQGLQTRRSLKSQTRKGQLLSSCAQASRLSEPSNAPFNGLSVVVTRSTHQPRRIDIPWPFAKLHRTTKLESKCRFCRL